MIIPSPPRPERLAPVRIASIANIAAAPTIQARPEIRDATHPPTATNAVI